MTGKKARKARSELDTFLKYFSRPDGEKGACDDDGIYFSPQKTMSHSKVRLWVHSIFSTRYREALILPSIESKIYQIVFNQFALSGCHVEQINGMPDHIHSLFLLNPQMALSDVIRICKGGSSHEINAQNLLPVKFIWQPGYWAFAVSESKVAAVKRYIQFQKTHHHIKDMLEELVWLERMHGLVP